MALDVDIDWKSFEKALGKHKKLMPWIWEDMVKKVQWQIVKDLRNEASARGYRKGKKGHVYKHIYSYTSKNGKMFSYVGFHHRTFVYSVLTGTSSISAKDDGYLTFYKDGSWHKVKTVALSPTDDFAGRIIKEWWESGKAEPILNAEFDRQLQKIYQRELNKLERK